MYLGPGRTPFRTSLTNYPRIGTAGCWATKRIINCLQQILMHCSRIHAFHPRTPWLFLRGKELKGINIILISGRNDISMPFGMISFQCVTYAKPSGRPRPAICFCIQYRHTVCMRLLWYPQKASTQPRLLMPPWSHSVWCDTCPDVTTMQAWNQSGIKTLPTLATLKTR